MKYGHFVVALCALGALGGCVVGQKHTLLTADPRVELAGEGPLAVSALDHRPYVVGGEKAAHFPGIAAQLRGHALRHQYRGPPGSIR
ncbi:MAG: hypothetical protein M5U09_24510 [Gammaproteobacteria bacterium]|nr:hypothetical protein [Gammaproteobacteria bacterium]